MEGKKNGRQQNKPKQQNGTKKQPNNGATETQQRQQVSELHKQALNQHQWDVDHQQYQWTPEELHMDTEGKSPSDMALLQPQEQQLPAGREQMLEEQSPDKAKLETKIELSPAMYSKEQENVAGSSQNTSDPSNLFSDISALNKARAKSKTEEEKEYFISVITSELPSLLHHLTAPELPKTSDDERFIQFMRFLEEHKVSDALQNVAETAISKLLETAGKRMSQEENIDPRIRKALESQSPEKLTFQKAFSDLSKILAKPNMLSSIGQEVSYVNPSEFSDKRYSEFLHLLEEKQIFASLQNVVDEAVNRLLNVVKEEEASSELDTSSQPKNKNNHAKTKKIQFT